MFNVPTEPADEPTVTDPEKFTAPPLASVSVPVPKLPMFRPRVTFQAELASVTVTEPWEPVDSPIEPPALLTVPPLMTVSIPVAVVAPPTVRALLLAQVE